MIKIEDYGFIKNVSKPSRYTGGELYEVCKEPSKERFNAAIAFPEVYDIGMCNLGLQILYNILNNENDIWAQRVFMPYPDMEAELKKRDMELYALESGRPLRSFDLVGFSLQYELTYTNVLAMLSLGKIPLRSEQRADCDPIIIAGGPSAINPEPMSAFIDAFFIGDGEEGFVEICRSLNGSKGKGRVERLIGLTKIEGVYVPALYEKEIDPDSGRIIVAKPKSESYPFPVKRRIVEELEAFKFPIKPLIPNHEVVHDRFSYEISRGCNVGCRFCEAGFFYRPVRHRSRATIVKDLAEVEKTTGYDGASLLSLSTGDYPKIENLLMEIKENFETDNYTLSFPSLRVSSLKPELLETFNKKKKMAFTIAPEAGTQRLRNVVNKKISDEEITNAAETLFSYGWSPLKLYFMIGLPTETDEDIEGIIETAKKIAYIGKKKNINRLNISVSTSSFVPKPFTPFQWESIASKEELQRKQERLKKSFRHPVSYKWHKIDVSLLEAVFSRGDSRLCDVLEKAHSLGCKLDSWTEHFNFELWLQAFNECGLNFDELLHAKFEEDDQLPWDIIDLGIKKEFFKRERKKAFEEELTDTCSGSHCFGCGDFQKFCRDIETERQNDEPVKAPAAKKEQGEARWYRAIFQKAVPLHLVGHLDFVKVLTMAFRRVGIKVEYSEGFHPFPKIEIASPLPLGVEGDEEMMDFRAFEFDLENAVDILNGTLPKGARIQSIYERTSADIALAKYEVHHYSVDLTAFSEADITDILEKAQSFFASESHVVQVEKKGELKEIDLRKKVLSGKIDGTRIELQLLNGGLFKVLEVFVPKEEIFRVRAKRLRLSIP
jgi:radical SAM family uncharacterized protein/radical SAM-linked protein